MLNSKEEKEGKEDNVRFVRLLEDQPHLLVLWGLKHKLGLIEKLDSRKSAEIFRM